MLRWSINLFRIRGIQLSLHSSFVLLVAYYGLRGYNAAGASGLVWAIALLFAFFTCVVLHELGHSLTARHFGVHVSRILLMPIGGMAQFDRIPREPGRELLITVAGPAVNFVIAGLLYLALYALRIPPDAQLVPMDLGEFFGTLAVVNLTLGCFNLVPAFPMDGGRILRALLAYRLPYLRATFWAATTGKILAVGAILFVAYLAWIGALPLFDAGLYAVLASFIFTVGEIEYRAIRAQDRYEAEFAQWIKRTPSAQTATFRFYHDQAQEKRPEEPPLLDPK